MELEQVRGPARGDRLAVGLDVVGGDDESPAVDLDAEEAVLQYVSAADPGRECRLALDRRGLGAARGDAFAAVRR